MASILIASGAILALHTLRASDQKRVFLRRAVAATRRVASVPGAAATTGWTLDKGDTSASATMILASLSRAHARREGA